MTIHEQEAEEALGKWSSSKYAQLERKKTFPVLRGGPDKPYGENVAQPKLIRHPDEDTVHFVFQGYDDQSKRSLYIGTIDEEFNVTYDRQLLANDYFSGYNSLDSPSFSTTK